MKHKLRSAQSTEGRRMAGARALCRGILICMKSGRW